MPNTLLKASFAIIPKENSQVSKEMRDIFRLSDLIRAHIEKTDPRTIFIDKIKTRKVAEDSSVEVPQLLRSYKSIDEIDFCDLPDRFVLKPTHFAAKQGVYLLNRTGESYYDLMSRRSLAEAEIIMDLRTLIGRKRTDIFVEELIVGENGPEKIPYDYKIYTFDEGTPVIVQIDRNISPLGIALLNERFDPLPQSDARLSTDSCQAISAVKPRNASSILETCRILLKSTGRPFMRVDLYTTGDRVVLGELTPTPGAPYYGSPYFFSPNFDTLLGGMVISGYRRRGWDVPKVSGTPPSWSKDKKFFVAHAKI